MRGSRASASAEPALRLAAGQRVQRRERLVQAQHGPPGEQRAQERDALAHAARQRGRPRALEPLQPERRRSARARGARAAERESPATRRASAALSSALSHGSSASRCGISAAGGALTVPASGTPARTPARAASTSRTRSARRPRRPRRAAARRSTPSSATTSRTPCARRRAGRQRAARTSRGPVSGASISVCIRSLRGHYPTGSKGQRRSGALSQPGVPPSPPVFTIADSVPMSARGAGARRARSPAEHSRGSAGGRSR